MFTTFHLLAAVATINLAPAPTIHLPDSALRTIHTVPGDDSLRVAAAIAEAERMAAVGRFADARRAYRRIISQERDLGNYPSVAMWRFADSWFAEGNEVEAAHALDDLAEAASAFGDPRMELRARFEAAVLYARHDEPARALELVEKVRTLLKSPVVDEALRLSITSRMGA